MPVIVLKKRSNIAAQANESNTSNNVFGDDMMSHTDKNNTQESYTEQIIFIPPNVTKEHSSDQSEDSKEDLISLKFYSDLSKH